MPVVSEVIANKAGFRPVLVDFQNGKIKPGEEGNLASALYRSKEKETVVAVTSCNMLYTGTVDNENDLYNNFILVNDKESGRIRLIQVDCCTVSPLFDKKSNLMDTSARISENSVSELRKQFGSKKTKRYTEQQERLKMNIDTVREQLEKTVSDIKIDETDVNLTPNENDNLYRPKINRDASTREQVYNLEDLVPQSVLDTLTDEALSIINSNDVEEMGLMPFVLKSISQILTSSDANKVQKITIFLYMHYLIEFMATPLKNMSRKFVVCETSEKVNSHILDNYTANTGNHRLRPPCFKDKGLCFVLVLAAIASDYEVDVELIAKDLKFGIKKVLETSRVLGFSATRNKSVVCLKLPLPAPVSVHSSRKRK